MLRIKKIKGEEGDCLEDDKVQEGDEKDLRRRNAYGHLTRANLEPFYADIDTKKTPKAKRPPR